MSEPDPLARTLASMSPAEVHAELERVRSGVTPEHWEAVKQARAAPRPLSASELKALALRVGILALGKARKPRGRPAKAPRRPQGGPAWVAGPALPGLVSIAAAAVAAACPEVARLSLKKLRLSLARECSLQQRQASAEATTREIGAAYRLLCRRLERQPTVAEIVARLEMRARSVSAEHVCDKTVRRHIAKMKLAGWKLGP